EFPATAIPTSAEAVFHELSVLGVTPVIAHPERNLVFAEQPERLERLVELGAMAPVTAASLLGEFGKRAQGSCARVCKRGLVQCVASDAHSVERRPPRLAEANDLVTARWGAEAARDLFAQDFLSQCVESSGS